MIKNLLLIMMSAVLVNNVILNQFLGVESALNDSRNRKKASPLSILVLIVMVVSSIIIWPINEYLLKRFSLSYLESFVYILIIFAVTLLINLIYKKALPNTFESIKELAPYVSGNSLVLGLCLINSDASYTFAESIFNTIGAGVGFMLALWLFKWIFKRIETANPPKAFKGLPIYLISAAIMSLAFYGFTGVFEKIFS